MNENSPNREPVEIIEIITPKCVNTHGSAPCTATETGDAKCFNTRNTCNDVPNYQAIPLSHLTPDLVLESGGTVDNTAIDFAADGFVEVEVRFSNDPSGTILAVGSASNFFYLGITGTDLVLAAGGNTAADQARATYAVSNMQGRNVTLIARIDYTSDTVFLYEFDPVELELTLLASDAADTALPAAWAASTDGLVGSDSGITYGSEDGGDYDSTITLARVYSDQTATLLPSQDAYRMKYYFSDGRKAQPQDDIYILPMLLNSSTMGSRLNLFASDDRYEPLGRRSFMELRFGDAPHSDYQVDPYRTDRNYDALQRSTFWRKWLIRNKFGRTRGLVRRYAGYDGQKLADMRTQTYVLDRASISREQVTIRCRDYLSLTEFRRAQVPAPSPGKLDLDLTAAATTFFAQGDVTDTYPTSGTVRIGDELMTYTGRSYDGTDDQTDFTGLVRGTDGSAADDHSAEDGIQICQRWTSVQLTELLTELLVDKAQIPAQLVDLAKIESEVTGFLTSYTLSTVISEPTGVAQLIGELAEQCSFYIWWNERRQIVDMQAIVAKNTVDYAFTQSADIIGDSFGTEERPKERITTINFLFLPRDFAGDLEKPVNFKRQLVVSNSETTGPDKFGNVEEIREIFSRWIQTEAQANETASRLSQRYAEIPQYAMLLLDAKDRQAWVGDTCTFEHDYVIDARGNFDTVRRWLIIEAEEPEPGHQQKITCVDITLDGEFYFITEDAQADYTAAAFAENLAFITDDAGLNSDGTAGALIQ